MADTLRKKIRGLYPRLDQSNSSFAGKAKKQLDNALQLTMGDNSMEAVGILQSAHDYALTIATNSGQ